MSFGLTLVSGVVAASCRAGRKLCDFRVEGYLNPKQFYKP